MIQFIARAANGSILDAFNAVMNPCFDEARNKRIALKHMMGNLEKSGKIGQVSKITILPTPGGC